MDSYGVCTSYRTVADLSEVDGEVGDMDEYLRKLTEYFGEEDSASAQSIFTSLLQFIQVHRVMTGISPASSSPPCTGVQVIEG